MDNIKKLPLRDFTRYCMSIAQVPSSYLSGLTLEEQLLWLCSFLTNEVIPTVNNNGEAVEELQALYIQLKDYVDNYFDNLDLQEEVNNKLEDMAQSGELAELISQYLEAQAVIGFNTNSSLAVAENLANGSFARTYGKETYNDGKGAFYKIRTRTNADVPDGDNIIVLTETENLVAEKMPDYRMNQAESAISNIQSDISDINQKFIKKYIFIGDSYNTTDTPPGGVPIVPWSTDLAQYLGLTSSDYYNSGVSGAGWVNGNTYLNQLQTLAGSMTSDEKNAITDIVVLGGINDAAGADIFTAIGSFSTYVTSNFPNAMITIGCISWAKGTANRENLRGKFQIYNNMSLLKNVKVLDNIFTAYHNYLHYQPDGHPNANGSMTIAYFVANALKGGENNVKWIKTGNIASTGNTLGISADTIGTYEEYFSGDKECIKLRISQMNTSNLNLITDGTSYTLGKIALESGYFDKINVLEQFNGWAYHGTTMTPIQGRIMINDSGTLSIALTGNGSTISGISILFIGSGVWYTIPAEWC